MDKFRISSLLLGTFLMPVVGYGAVGFGSAGFGRPDAQFAGVIVSDEALFSAIRNGNFELVNYLLDHGANVNAHGKEPRKEYYGRPFDHFTPLSLAIQASNFDMVNLLIDRDADVNDPIEELEVNYGGTFTHYLSPLVVAIRTGNIGMVRLLLERGANVNTQGGKYNVPIYEAIIKRAPVDMISLLLAQKGINVNVPQDIEMSYDEYELRGYGGDPYDYQVPETALGNIEKVGIGSGPKAHESYTVVRLLREKGARSR